MAKTKVTPGWVGPIKQANEGKRPFYCDYGDWATSDKRRQKLGYTKKDAEREYIRFMERMETKTHAPTASRTFGEVLDEYERWCEERWHLKQSMSGSYLELVRCQVRNHVRPALGHVRLRELDTHMIEAFINELARRGYKDTHRSVYIIVQKALDRAVYLDWLAISPLTKKKPMLPPRVQPVTSIPTIEEGRALWHAIQDRGYDCRVLSHINGIAACALAMFGGCERGVVCALHWEDVDFIDNVINIKRSWSRSPDGLKGTKNKFRVRTIPMSVEIRESLDAVWQRSGRPSTGYVFFSKRDGGGTRYGLYSSIYVSFLCRSMRKAGFVDATGKPLWNFHELRHYAGSVWLEAGATIQEVSRLLGHSNINTTQKHYIHYFKRQEAERHRAIADKVSAMHRLPAPMRDKCEINVEDAEVI